MVLLLFRRFFYKAHLPGLQIGTAYEARVSYFTDCNTMSEASDPSKPCLPAQGKDDGPGTVPHSVPVASPAPAPVPMKEWEKILTLLWKKGKSYFK